MQKPWKAKAIWPFSARKAKDIMRKAIRGMNSSMIIF